MQKIRGEIADRRGMSGNESVVCGQRGGGKRGELIAQRVHFLLQSLRVLLRTHPGVPAVNRRMMWVLDFLPGGSVLLLETGDQLLRLGRQLQFRMSGGKQQDVGSGLANLWRLLFNGEVSAEERYQVDGDQRQGNNRQAPRRHILVFDGEKHGSPLLSC